MKFNPYDYQKTAIRWVLDHPRCALLLDMGLGKSIITLTAIQQLMDACEVTKTLIVAPKKVAETTWTDEAEKWDHLKGLRVARVMGTETQRIRALASTADIYVIGRDSFVWLVGRYAGLLPFDMLIIDELTSFKSSKSGRFKAMRIVSSSFQRVVGLTGTPSPNSLVDLWAQMYCIDGGERLGKSITRYRDAYFKKRVWNNIVVKCTPKPGTEAVLKAKLSDICLSMQAKDYLQLPDMMVHTVKVELSSTVMKAYNKFEKDKVMEFEAEHSGDQAYILANSAAGLINKLSQFANGAVYDVDGCTHYVHDEKLIRLVEIVEAANSPVLVFYQYKHDVMRIKEKLKGFKVCVYTGAEDLKQWNAGNIDVLLAHPASTAFGLNMQRGGHYIVWFGTGWNLELYQQANARLHRQGQKYPVQVYRLVCMGTVDERAVAALENKKSVQQNLMDSLNYLIRKHSKQTI